MSTSLTAQPNRMAIVKMVVTIGLPLSILLIPVNEVFSHTLRLYFAVTLFAILAFAFENFNTTLIALALPFAYTLFNIAPAAVVFSPWATNVVWMVLGGIMLADMANKTGFLRRIAYKCIILTGGTYRGIIWGLGLAGIIATLLLAGNGIIPMAALAFGICNALEIKKTKAAAGVMLASAFGCILSATFLFNVGPAMYAGFAGMSMSLSWIEYFTHQAVGVIYFVVVFFVMERLCRPKEGLNGKDYFVEQYQTLGKASADEKKAAAICILLLVMLMTTNIHHIQAMWVFAIVPLLAYLPGINVCDTKDMNNTNFGMVFFTAACMSIGTVGTALGIGQIVSEIAIPILAGKSFSFIFFFIYILFVLLNFVMTPVAIAAAFTMPFAQICLSLGINPEAFFLFETVTLDQVFLPYEYVMYLVVFSFGAIQLKDFVQLMTMKFVMATLYIFLLLIPFWRLIGFLTI